ncbi:MAG: 2-phospho-L-lactate transferase [Myxococcota bacterium]
MCGASNLRVVALAGGVGAARFLSGLVQVVPPEDVTAIVNTGDDREFFGLRVCPDLDIVTYTLAGVVRQETGWGLEGDHFECLEALRRFRDDAWFALGDRDLATHIHRSDRLRRGASLREVSAEIARAFGVRTRLLPMTEDPAPTRVVCHDGRALDFEEYLVREGAPDDLRAVDLSAAQAARAGEQVLEAIRGARHLLICPSNPVVSIGTIRAIPEIERALRARADAVAVSPLIGGAPVKGPADRLLRAIGSEVSCVGVSQLYRDIARGIVIDRVDEAEAARIRALGLEPRIEETLMRTPQIAARLARAALELSEELR